MAVEARINPPWLYKWLIVAAGLILFGGWCLYDATVAYPEHNRHVQAFQEFQDAGRMEQWPEYARQQGWSAEAPGEPKSGFDIWSQWVMLGICWSLAAAALILAGLHYNKKLIADATHLHGANGKSVPYESITSIDKERWDSKGIAVAHYEMDGRKGRIKIDDWVFRDADLVLDEVEKQTGLGDPLPA